MQATYEPQPLTKDRAEGTLSSPSEFVELRRIVKGNDQLPRAAAFPWFTVALLLTMIAVVSALIVLWPRDVAVEAVNGILLGFIFTQIGFLMHDAGHRQLFRLPASNRVMGLICGNLMVGINYDWWMDKHNRHHKNPNHIDDDPDLDFAVLALCQRQAPAKGWFWWLIVKYQAFLFVPFLLLEYLSLQLSSLRHVLQKQGRQRRIEGFLLVCHHISYFGTAFGLLGLKAGLAFIVCSKAFTGLYAGLVFAPNHKGMLVIDENSQLNVLRRQVLTSRNVRPGLINDFLYGALNYQIEHHLFPFLKRSQMAAARKIVKPFCQERGIPYHETGVFQSLKEIFCHLHEVGGLQSRPRQLSTYRALRDDYAKDE